MIFREIHRKINTKKALDKEYMFSLFKKRKEKFLARGEKLTDLNIELVRNFREKFRNMSLKYVLFTTKGKRVFRAKIHKYQDISEKEWELLNWLRKLSFKQGICCPLYYFRPLNIFFYEDVPGISFEELLSQHRIKKLLEITPRIAKWLKKFHSTSGKKRFLSVKNLKEELKERRHWYFLVRKCAPSFYKDFSRLLKDLWKFRESFSSPESLVHSDFHWGNIIKIKNQKSTINNQFRVIDFGYAFYGDPLEDVGGFLAQNDSMFRYYGHGFLKKGREIKEIFLKNYFQKKLSESEKNRLAYFEIKKILEMAAILALVESNEDNKARGITTLLKEAEKKIERLS